MFCKPCNTRLPQGQKVCPNCGRSVAGTPMVSSSTQDRIRKARRDKLPPTSPARSQSQDPVDIELEEVAAAQPRKSKRKKAPAMPPRKSVPSPSRDPVDPQPAESLFALDPSQLGGVLADQPELLEDGLSVYTDETGAAVGVDFATDVGVIDLLATDQNGDFVIVQVVGSAQGGPDLVSQALMRIGWVVKHLGKGNRGARAILLLDAVPDELSYAVTAVADRVALKTYQIELSFYDVEV